MASAEEIFCSPFLHPGLRSSAKSLAILHLRRDQLLPTFLHKSTKGADYAEGHVTNTRFGSFPHSTLMDVPWGSQVLASQVDTGSRGRKDTTGRGKKRKIEDVNATEVVESGEQEAISLRQQTKSKAPVTAASGFVHVLPPTPETWTISLPHRTQVVYTPDYSHILQKLRVRPGSSIIEAGAGSGSFTHAAARAVFNGYSFGEKHPMTSEHKNPQPLGKVYSFEYHEPRAQTLQAEIVSHGLTKVVQVTHRDVYTDGFLVPPSSSPALLSTQGTGELSSPGATAVFLDLPAPWLALPHLTRTSPSPLNPQAPVHICCFLPCIEQAQKAVSILRTHGWVEIYMHELACRRIEVRREIVGLDYEGLRGVNASPATVDEALAKLIQVEKNARNPRPGNTFADYDGDEAATGNGVDTGDEVKTETRAERLARIASSARERKIWKEGKLVTRTEPEIKTHTSYLIFAVLPMEWTKEDEERCRAKWTPTRKEDNGEQIDGDNVSGKRRKGKQAR